MKSGKAPGKDRFPVEYVKKGGISVLEWLVRLLNVSFDMGVVPICTVVVHVLRPYGNGRLTNVNVAIQEVLVC